MALGLFRKVKDYFGAVRLDELRHEEMTLGQLVVAAAASPVPDVLEALYGRLPFSKVGIRAPESPGILRAGGRVLGEDDKITIPTRRGSHGKSYLEVYCDIPAMWAESPGQVFLELDARVVLEMAQSHGLGVICQNSAGGRKAWIAVAKEDVTGILGGRYPHTVVVPPDHRVAVVRASSVAYFAQKESGVWIADLGRGGETAKIISHVREEAAKGQPMQVVWIVESVVLENPAELSSVIAALDSLIQTSGDLVKHSAVVPYGTERHRPMMTALKEAGVEVYFGGPQGECFIEEHTAEELAVSFPGREL